MCDYVVFIESYFINNKCEFATAKAAFNKRTIVR